MYLQNSDSIQPRTSGSKFADTYLAPRLPSPHRTINTALMAMAAAFAARVRVVLHEIIAVYIIHIPIIIVVDSVT